MQRADVSWDTQPASLASPHDPSKNTGLRRSQFSAATSSWRGDPGTVRTSHHKSTPAPARWQEIAFAIIVTIPSVRQPATCRFECPATRCPARGRADRCRADDPDSAARARSRAESLWRKASRARTGRSYRRFRRDELVVPRVVDRLAGALDEKNLSLHARISDGLREFDDLRSVRPFHEGAGATPLRRSSFISNAIRCQRASQRIASGKQPLPWPQDSPPL